MNYILNSFGAIVRNLHRTRLVIQKAKVRMAKRTLELAKVKAFQGLNHIDLLRLFKRMKRQEFKEGEVIFYSIDVYSSLYFILSGKVLLRPEEHENNPDQNTETVDVSSIADLNETDIPDLMCKECKEMGQYDVFGQNYMHPMSNKPVVAIAKFTRHSSTQTRGIPSKYFS